MWYLILLLVLWTLCFFPIKRTTVALYLLDKWISRWEQRHEGRKHRLNG